MTESGISRLLGLLDLRTQFPCAVCDYEFLGIDQSGVCPECGEPVANSHPARIGRIIGPDRLRRIVFGCVLFIAIFPAIAIAVVLFILIGGYLSPMALNIVLVVLGAGFAIADAAAWWCIATPGRRAEFGRVAPRVARAAGVILLASIGTLVCVEYVSRDDLDRPTVFLVPVVIWLLRAFFSFVWLSFLMPGSRRSTIRRNMTRAATTTGILFISTLFATTLSVFNDAYVPIAMMVAFLALFITLGCVLVSFPGAIIWLVAAADHALRTDDQASPPERLLPDSGA
jgi:hypothetical protein